MSILTPKQIALDLLRIRHYVITEGEKQAIAVYKEDELLEVLEKWGLGDPPKAKELAKDLKDY